MAAAEQAISNPLLDDINLSGACGILVNITAGPDFSMREFDEVGRTIEEFASEDATVVIGTVLDPDMKDDVRVTVVATGLNRNAARQPLRPETALPQQRPVKLVRNATTGQVDYGALPPNATVGAVSTAGVATAARVRVPEGGPDSTPMDYLDIPAFLRRQAD
jgi:cell division protein FtsZ